MEPDICGYLGNQLLGHSLCFAEKRHFSKISGEGAPPPICPPLHFPAPCLCPGLALRGHRQAAGPCHNGCKAAEAAEAQVCTSASLGAVSACGDPRQRSSLGREQAHSLTRTLQADPCPCAAATASLLTTRPAPRQGAGRLARCPHQTKPSVVGGTFPETLQAPGA